MENQLKFFGRRKGKKLRENRQRLITDFLETVKINPEKPFAFSEIFPSPFAKYVLEIGFGGGEHVAAMSERDKDTGFIGAEVFINGIASLLAHLTGYSERAELAAGRADNVRIYPDDIRKILPFFPSASLDAVYLLFPDPWPKSRHKERRFINNGNLDELSRILKPGGKFYAASDDMTYIRWALSVMNRRNDFDIKWTKASEYFTEPDGWIQTRYELKALKQGKKPVYLVFIRK